MLNNKKHRLIYIAGPYTAKTKQDVKINISKAEEAAKQILLLTKYIPVIPHKITSFFEADKLFKNRGRNDWLEKFCLPLLGRCDAIFLIDGWGSSDGAIIENKFARANNIDIYINISDIVLNKPWGIKSERKARNRT